jgi:hypothetical protein
MYTGSPQGSLTVAQNEKKNLQLSTWKKKRSATHDMRGEIRQSNNSNLAFVGHTHSMTEATLLAKKCM